MFRSRASRGDATSIDRLTKNQGNLLQAGESFVATCAAFAADEPDPNTEAERGWPFSEDELLSARGAAHLRLAAVRAQMGMVDDEFHDLPQTSDEYLVAQTERRLFLFADSAKSLILEADLDGIWLQPFEHPDGAFTLVFRDDETRVAVTTPRASVEQTRELIASFPDRRSQPRVARVAGEPTIIEFK